MLFLSMSLNSKESIIARFFISALFRSNCLSGISDLALAAKGKESRLTVDVVEVCSLVGLFCVVEVQNSPDETLVRARLLSFGQIEACIVEAQL